MFSSDFLPHICSGPYMAGDKLQMRHILKMALVFATFPLLPCQPTILPELWLYAMLHGLIKALAIVL